MRTSGVGMTAVTILVVAKAPVPGRAKTRIAAGLGDHTAAEIAAAALLDTLDAVAATPVHARVVALTGDLGAACRSDELCTRLADFTVVEQRGDGFAQRLAQAHADAAAAGGPPVFQIGMDTPQVTPELLHAGARLLLDAPAVLGPACDGGWWALGAQRGVRPLPARRADVAARHRRRDAARTARRRRGRDADPRAARCGHR